MTASSAPNVVHPLMAVEPGASDAAPRTSKVYKPDSKPPFTKSARERAAPIAKIRTAVIAVSSPFFIETNSGSGGDRDGASIGASPDILEAIEGEGYIGRRDQRACDSRPVHRP